MPIRYFSMFSGIGGFEYGIQQSNYDFECVGFCEIDKYAVSIYERNYPNHINFGDVTKIKTKDLPDFDFLVGGFPCQAFSVAGKRGGFDDTRGTLFFEIARILKDKRPRYFLLENVRGLLSHDKGKTFQTILEVLSDLGYVVQWTLLNSSDFQVPQRRERVFIEGYFRGNGGSEILSVRRNCQKNPVKVSNTMYGVRQGRIHYSDEHMNTLTCSGHNGGSSQLIVEDENTPNIKKIGNFSPSNHHGKNVYDSDGLCPTLCSGSIVRNGMNILERKDELIVDKIKKPILKRKYDVDIPGLQNLLRTSKEKSGLSNKDIANKLDLPLTTVEHWFRTDNSFSIPSKEIWFDLKKVLKINNNSFDSQLTEFIEIESEYDMTNRVYSDIGVAPTLKSSTQGELIKEHTRELKCINPKAGQAQKIYEINGLATTLSANGGGQGGKTGLYKVKR